MMSDTMHPVYFGGSWEVALRSDCLSTSEAFSQKAIQPSSLLPVALWIKNGFLDLVKAQTIDITKWSVHIDK